MALQLSESSSGFCWRTHADHTPQTNTARWLLIGAALVSLVIGGGFALIGAWLVLPFAGLEIAALWLGLHYFAAHAADHEEIMLDDRALRVVRHDGRRVTEHEFPAYWVQVRLLPASAMAPAAQLFVGSHGKSIEIGRLLPNGQKQVLARTLREALRQKSGADLGSHPISLSEKPNQP